MGYGRTPAPSRRLSSLSNVEYLDSSSLAIKNPDLRHLGQRDSSSLAVKFPRLGLLGVAHPSGPLSVEYVNLRALDVVYLSGL